MLTHQPMSACPGHVCSRMRFAVGTGDTSVPMYLTCARTLTLTLWLWCSEVSGQVIPGTRTVALFAVHDPKIGTVVGTVFPIELMQYFSVIVMKRTRCRRRWRSRAA